MAKVNVKSDATVKAFNKNKKNEGNPMDKKKNKVKRLNTEKPAGVKKPAVAVAPSSPDVNKKSKKQKIKLQVEEVKKLQSIDTRIPNDAVTTPPAAMVQHKKKNKLATTSNAPPAAMAQHNKKNKLSTTSSAAPQTFNAETELVGKKKNKHQNKLKALSTDEEGSPVKKGKSKNIPKTESDGEPTKVEGAIKKDGISVFVGNIPIKTQRKKLLRMFSRFGTVTSIRFRKSNGGKFFKSKSLLSTPNLIAFVDFEKLEQAQASLVMNGEKINDNVIRVNLQQKAKAKTATAEGFDGKRTVFVGNLKYTVTDQLLLNMFSCCGAIDYVRTLQCEQGCNGTAYVCFKDAASVSMALELNKTSLEGREMRVQRYTLKEQNKGGAQRRLKEKKKSTEGKKKLMVKTNKAANGAGNESPMGKKKKGDAGFGGVKVNEKKKNQNKNKSKKGGLKGPKLLAKKIAPRTDKITA